MIVSDNRPGRALYSTKAVSTDTGAPGRLTGDRFPSFCLASTSSFFRRFVINRETILFFSPSPRYTPRWVRASFVSDNRNKLPSLRVSRSEKVSKKRWWKETMVSNKSHIYISRIYIKDDGRGRFNRGVNRLRGNYCARAIMRPSILRAI